MDIVWLKDLYTVMLRSRDARRQLVQDILGDHPVDPSAVRVLDEVHASLKRLAPKGESVSLRIAADRSLPVDCSYELNELEKDSHLLADGEEAFWESFEASVPGMAQEIAAATVTLGDPSYVHCVTDRDGTVNNYCGRYGTSVQSIYNALALTRFARSLKGRSIMLTAAPMEGPGLIDMNVMPQGAFVFAASKGREFIDLDGTRGQFPVDDAQQEILDALNRELQALVREDDFEKFAQIGSGLQMKFGQTTVAYQDISGSIPSEEMSRFKGRVHEILRSLDPHRRIFRTEETGKDLEILLTIESVGDTRIRDFDKGDGVKFLDGALSLGLEKGVHLVCGDTASDLPMAEAVLAKSPDSRAVFVTRDEDFQSALRKRFPHAAVVSCPDTLIALLRRLCRGNKP